LESPDDVVEGDAFAWAASYGRLHPTGKSMKKWLRRPHLGHPLVIQVMRARVRGTGDRIDCGLCLGVLNDD